MVGFAMDANSHTLGAGHQFSGSDWHSDTAWENLTFNKGKPQTHSSLRIYSYVGFLLHTGQSLSENHTKQFSFTLHFHTYITN